MFFTASLKSKFAINNIKNGVNVVNCGNHRFQTADIRSFVEEENAEDRSFRAAKPVLPCPFSAKIRVLNRPTDPFCTVFPVRPPHIPLLFAIESRTV